MRYLITQSLLSSWSRVFDATDSSYEDALADFSAVLQREPREKTRQMEDGIAFETEVYAEAAGVPRLPHPRWEPGIRAVAKVIQGAPVQVKASRELHLPGATFLVSGSLDALKAGTIYDVKFTSSSLASRSVAGKYLCSVQHPTYFFVVPEATEFKYLVSDGSDLYVESYPRDDCEPLEDIILRFLQSIQRIGLIETYREKWKAKE